MKMLAALTAVVLSQRNFKVGELAGVAAWSIAISPAVLALKG